MATALLTPFTRQAAVELSGHRWWKKLLPVGVINYKGRQLKFTRDYLSGLMDAFRKGAYDQVPFQLAGDENKHTNDVERYGGKITDMALRGDGLWVELSPTERGEKVLRDNPECGVSARIVEAYDRADGKFFPKAIQHVLATLDPRIPGMGPWQTVEAANGVDMTFDLSGAEFAGEETAVAELDEDQKTKLARLLQIPAERLEKLAALTDEDLARLNGGGGEGEGDGGELSDAELEALADAALELDEAGLLDEKGEPEPATAGSSLSSEAAMAVELASAQGAEAMRQLGVINTELDRERWANERQRLVRSGVPPFIADLAQPLLEGSGHVVDLASGDTVDAGQVMRKVLTEYARLGEQLGIGDAELGSPMDVPDDEPAGVKAREEIISLAKQQLSLG